MSLSASRPSLSSLYQDAFTCIARYLSLGSLAMVCCSSRVMRAKVAGLPQFHRMWTYRFDRTFLPTPTSPLRLIISRLRWEGDQLASDCALGGSTLMQRIPELLVLHCNFQPDSWQDRLGGLCRCLLGNDAAATLEYRSHIRTLHLRWELRSPSTHPVPAMLVIAQCLPQLTDLTLIGNGTGAHAAVPMDMLAQLRPLRTIERLVIVLDHASADVFREDAMDAILSLPQLTRLELQHGWLSADGLRAMLSDAAKDFRKRVVHLQRCPGLMGREAQMMLTELEKLCTRLTP